MKKYVIICLLISGIVSSQTSVSGYVYNDVNKNQQKDRQEKGIENVAVSNGVEVVLTDKQGRYHLPMKEDQTVFVIKPSGYKVPLNERNLPQFYYHHKPKGSPSHYKYQGVLPTGPLPKELNFSLQKQTETNNFDILVFGDPQPYTEKELDYFKRGIVNEVKNNKKNAVFGISLGDLVGDNLDLQKPYAEVMKEIDLPWYNVMGNHDMNYEAKEDHLSDETFEANFGPANYSFNYGKVHFIILDNILYPDPRTKKGYWGGFREDQLRFIENDLKLVDQNQLIVVSFHIPLNHQNENSFRNADRQKLFDFLSPFSNVLLLSAHTHLQQQLFYGKKDGWNGSKDLHEYNAATTSGDWYSGIKDEAGLPTSTMRDGTLKGYSFIHFKDNKYDIKYKAFGKAEEYQIKLYVPKVIPFPSRTSAKIVANFFMGNQKDQVEYRIDQGAWKAMDYKETIDPKFAQSVYQWDTTEKMLEGRRPSNPELSTHIWVGGFTNKLSAGHHTVEIRAVDMFGNKFSSSETFEVQNAIPIP